MEDIIYISFFLTVLALLAFALPFCRTGNVLLRAYHHSLHAWYLQLLTDPPAVPFHLSLFSALLPSLSPTKSATTSFDCIETTLFGTKKKPSCPEQRHDQ